MTQPPKLRVGFIIDGPHLPAWARYVIEELADCDFAVPVVLVVDRKETVEQRPLGLFNKIGRFAWRLYLYADRRVSGLGRSAFQMDDVPPVLHDLPVEAVPPIEQGGSEADSPAAAESLRSYDLDVLVSLSSGGVRDDLAGEAKNGVWTLYRPQPDTPSQLPNGFWDAVEGCAVTCCELRTLNADGGAVIARSRLATDAWSISRNQHRYYWRGASLIIRKLRELQRLGDGVSLPAPRMSASSLAPPPQTRLPLLQQGLRLVRFLSRHVVFRNQWALLYCFGDQAPDRLEGYQLLQPPRDRFLADPFVIQRRDRFLVFVEEYIYSKGKGHISLMEVDETGRFGQPVTLVDEPYHLSYPFVFQWRGAYYLIPESGGNSGIDIYRCVDFPYKWKKYKTLMDGRPFADATLFYHDDRWWLFVNIADHPGASTWDELFVFHADNPLSDHWEPHARNPVVSDATRARPAGRIFLRDGYLYRPSQDCSKGYGYGLRINRINKLTPLEYEETVVSSILPSGQRGIRGVHTFNQAGRLSMMDAKLRRLRGL